VRNDPRPIRHDDFSNPVLCGVCDYGGDVMSFDMILEHMRVTTVRSAQKPPRFWIRFKARFIPPFLLALLEY